MRRQGGTAAAAAAVLGATVLPWSSTASAGRTGWGTASLALALDEAVHRPVLTVLACVFFAVPLAAAAALVGAALLPRRGAVVALRSLGVLLVLAVGTVLVALYGAGVGVSLFGPLLALAGGVALVALPARFRPLPFIRRRGVAVPGVQ